MRSLLISIASLLSVAADANDDKVLEIKGMTKFSDYGLYSGYLDIVNTTKSLHYVFAESQNDPATDPLLLWFNGGPGCSSMLAWMQENGPWVMDNGESSFHENPYSWNKNASVIYLDQPAGIGYSYCNETESPEDCHSGDYASSLDNLDVLKTWFGRFPEYKDRDLYLSGESYAGIYVPYLLKQIDAYNNDPETAESDIINLKGMMVGNGVTNWKYDTMPATINMGYWRSLISQDLHDSINQLACNFS
jgi:carboxypeptidase C (cathepsin A)